MEGGREGPERGRRIRKDGGQSDREARERCSGLRGVFCRSLIKIADGTEIFIREGRKGPGMSIKSDSLEKFD